MESYRVKPGEKVHLDKIDPRETGDVKKDKAVKETTALIQRLEALQEVFYAEGQHKLLIVLQGMDTSGKDGVIRNVFDGVNPQGVRVASFKVPTPVEAAHDYLWRIHQQTPARGEIVIFNRSHYEDVLVVRVHELVSKEIWSRRYDQINAFEKHLAEEGVTILKFFLHISKDEQRERLLERLDDPAKHWKFSAADLKERELWPQYMEAYEDALERTSTDWAPWHIIPADRKWFRNLAIARAIISTIEGMDLRLDGRIPDADVAAYKQALG